jgi:hypothetical protein
VAQPGHPSKPPFVAAGHPLTPSAGTRKRGSPPVAVESWGTSAGGLRQRMSRHGGHASMGHWSRDQTIPAQLPPPAADGTLWRRSPRSTSRRRGPTRTSRWCADGRAVRPALVVSSSSSTGGRPDPHQRPAGSTFPARARRPARLRPIAMTDRGDGARPAGVPGARAVHSRCHSARSRRGKPRRKPGFRSTATGIRTPVSAVRGRRPSPLDDGGRTRDTLATGPLLSSPRRRPADVAELVDAHGSGPCGGNSVEVRVLSSASCRNRASRRPDTGAPKRRGPIPGLIASNGRRCV